MLCTCVPITAKVCMKHPTRHEGCKSAASVAMEMCGMQWVTSTQRSFILHYSASSSKNVHKLKWVPILNIRWNHRQRIIEGLHSNPVYTVAKPSVGKLIAAAGRTGYPNVKDRSIESHRGQYAKPNFLIFKSDKICISPQLNLLQKWCLTPFRQFWFLDNVNLTKTSVIGTKVIFKFCQISYGLNNGTLSLSNNTILTLYAHT